MSGRGRSRAGAGALVAGGLDELMRASTETQSGSYSASTQRKYRAAFERFQGFCFTAGVKPLPAAGDVVAAYLEHLSRSYSLNSIRLELAGVCKAHELCKLESPRYAPAVRRWLKGYTRRCEDVVSKARPLSPVDVWKMVDAIANAPTGSRDRALILVGYATGMREAELCALNVEDLEAAGEDYLARIRSSKTDPGRAGLTAGIPRLLGRECCPCAALEAYLLEHQLDVGPLFRGAYRGGVLRDTRLHVSSVDEILRRAARAAKIPAEGISGHSLRRGIATAATDAGCTLQEVAGSMRHKSLHTAIGYIGDRDVLRNHVLRRVNIG